MWYRFYKITVVLQGNLDELLMGHLFCDCYSPVVCAARFFLVALATLAVEAALNWCGRPARQQDVVKIHFDCHDI